MLELTFYLRRAVLMFNESFAKSSWIRLAERKFEVIVGDCKLINDLLVNVDEINLSSDLLERGFRAKSG